MGLWVLLNQNRTQISVYGVGRAELNRLLVFVGTVICLLSSIGALTRNMRLNAIFQYWKMGLCTQVQMYSLLDVSSWQW